VSGFDAGWLALRETADARSRSAVLAQRLGNWIATRAPYRPPRLVDLGCGTGANVRYLAPRLGDVSWVCIDDDPTLLSQLQETCPGLTVDARHLDLVRNFDALAAMPFDALTCSALLDLVSGSWLGALVALIEQRRAAVLFALSYDGELALTPSAPSDEAVRKAFNAHQVRDKGFGAALGPRAGEVAEHALVTAGYETLRIQSPWHLDARAPADAALLAPLIAGIAGAATEQFPADRERFESWHSMRRAQCARGELGVTIGHADLLGLPPAHDQ
jgi:SAM-dependent methyltransferase